MWISYTKECKYLNWKLVPYVGMQRWLAGYFGTELSFES